MTPKPLTPARFAAALQARDISPGKTDRDAAFTIALFLDDCTRLLRDAAAPSDDDR